MLERGDSVPHFAVRTVEGELFSYSSIWQHKNLLLVTIPTLDSESYGDYITELTTHLREAREQNLECVITQDPVPGMSAPAVLVADRWGAVIFAAERPGVQGLPSPQDLIEWLTYVNNQCPECEGETK